MDRCPGGAIIRFYSPLPRLRWYHRRSCRLRWFTDSHDHYIHHAKFNFNFGSGLFPNNGIWDNLLNTAYKASASLPLVFNKTYTIIQPPCRPGVLNP